MLDTLIEHAIATYGALGFLIGLLVYALVIERREKREVGRKLEKAKDQLHDEAKATGALMRDVEAAMVLTQSDQEARILHRDRVERVLDRIEKRL